MEMKFQLIFLIIFLGFVSCKKKEVISLPDSTVEQAIPNQSIESINYKDDTKEIQIEDGETLKNIALEFLKDAGEFSSPLVQTSHLKIVNKYDNLILLNYPKGGSDTFFVQQSVWFKKDGKWTIFKTHDLGSNSTADIDILHINNDNIYDIVTRSGCCDTDSYTVNLGQKEGEFKEVFTVTATNGSPDLKNGKCENFILKIKTNDGIQHIYTFDCSLNKIIDR